MTEYTKALATLLKIVHNENMALMKCLVGKSHWGELYNTYDATFDYIYKQIMADNEVDDGK